MKQPIQFLGKEYATKLALDKFVTLKLLAITPGRIQSIHVPFFDALIDRHPDAEAKRAFGVSGYYLKRDAKGNPHTSIIAMDGTHVVFSWRTCITGKPKTQLANLSAAMRDAIQDQIEAFRNDAPCAICFAPSSEVDHVEPFYKLRNRYLEARCAPDGVVLDREGGGAKLCPESPFTRDWKAYHQMFAELRMLCQKCNNRSWRK